MRTADQFGAGDCGGVREGLAVRVRDADFDLFCAPGGRRYICGALR
jgi:hypothetical protein